MAHKKTKKTSSFSLLDEIAFDLVLLFNRKGYYFSEIRQIAYKMYFLAKSYDND